MVSNPSIKRLARSILILSISVWCLGTYQASAGKPSINRGAQISADAQAALDRISAASLRGHLSFIASDQLEGRNTPSRGLDIAAEYIAAQFRRAGLEPAGDDGYFQTADWLLAEIHLESLKLRVGDGSQMIDIDKGRVSLSLNSGIKLSDAPVLKVDYADKAQIASLDAGQVKGKVVLTEIPDFRREDRSRWPEMFQAQMEFLSKMERLNAALIVSVDRVSTAGAGAGDARLINPQNRQASAVAPAAPLITVHDPRVVKVHDELKAGATGASLSIEAAGPVERPIKLRNCIGLLRGSDPALKDSYVLVTAHYDHLGVRGAAGGDRIFNGANDDGSGTVSVIELASALATLKQRPRRSLVFMTFFGEEKGLLGSRHYASHPVFPIEKTVANINLEQVGRTDSSEGPQLSNATLTGFDYSDISATLKRAGELTAVNLYKHELNSDAFFSRSDNQALADRGVPAHTLCVAYVYPDYHGPGDHWEKIDYENMAKVNRMLALGLIMIADSAQAPKWNEANPKTARYVRAWKALRAR